MLSKISGLLQQSKIVRLFLYSLFGLLLTLLLTTQVIVRYFVWPQLEIRKEQIEKIISAELGINATIGSIQTNWEFFRPSFEIRDISFKKDTAFDDSLKNKVLHVPTLSGILSWSSLWFGSPRFYHLQSEGISLTAQRDANGLWNIAGMPLSNSSSDTRAMEWILNEKNLSANLLQVKVIDDFEGNSINEFTIEKFSLRNESLQHQIELKAYVKPTQGILNFSGQFEHKAFSNPSNWRNWVGDFHSDIKKINAANLLKITKLPIKSGSGQIEFDGHIKLNNGIVETSNATLNANQVNIIWANKQPDLHLNKLQIDLSQTNKNNDHLINVNHFIWQFQDNTQELHQISGLNLSITPNSAKNSIAKVSINAPEIPLSELSRLIQSIPLPSNVFSPLHKTKPKGLLQEFHLTWHKNSQEYSFLNKGRNTVEFEVSGILKNLGWQKYNEQIPGVENLSGELKSGLDEGFLIINSPNLSINSDHYFQQNKINLPPTTGKISWKRQDSEWLIVEDLLLKDASSELKASGSYLTSNKVGHDVLDLNLQLSKMSATTFLNLVPKTIAPSTFEYLKSTIAGGTLLNSSVVIHGPIDQIPYSKNSSNQFKINVNVIDGVYRPVAPNKNDKGEWPYLEKVKLSMQMDKNLLKIEAPTALYKNVVIKDINADMDISKLPNVLKIKGSASGPLNDFLNYLVTTPVAYKWQSEFKKMGFAGNANLDLQLSQQFGDKENTKLNAQVSLAKNQIRWGNNPPATISKGSLTINENGLRKADINGNFMGGPLLIKTNPNDENQIDIRADMDSTLLAELLAVNGDINTDLNQKILSGKIGIQGSLLNKNNDNSLNLNLDLKSTSINLPKPFQKNAGETLLGNLKLNVLSSSNSFIDWQLKLGNMIQTVGQTSEDKIHHALVAIGNAKLPTVSNGIHIAFDVDMVDIDKWLHLIGDFEKDNPNFSERFKTKNTNQTSVVPIHVSGKASTVNLLGSEIVGLNIEASENQGNWSAAIKAKDIEGNVAWQAKNTDLPFGAIRANFKDLKIPQSTSTTSTSVSKRIPKASIKSLPSIDLSVDNFSFGKMQFGEVKLQGQASLVEWELTQLRTKNKFGEIILKGLWDLPSGNDIGKTKLNFDLQTSDAGEFLSSMDMGEKVMSRGKGSIQGNLNWQGSPVDFNAISLSGDIKLEMKNGSILQVDPGAAKLLGILSLQSLLKFATLNFDGTLGDSVKAGTPFDEITASGNIRRGNIRSNDFEMKSTLARITSRGIVNLNRETQDLRITIYPRINFGSASLAAFYFVTPIIGITTMIGQYLFSTGINKALQTDLLVQGDWKNPEVIPLDQSGKPLDQETLQNIRRKSLLNEPPKNPSEKRSEPTFDPSKP